MMKKCNKNIALALLGTVLAVVFLPFISHAQPDIFPDPDAPIDGGLSLLVAAGVGYGIKKANDQRKKRKEENVDVDKL